MSGERGDVTNGLKASVDELQGMLADAWRNARRRGRLQKGEGTILTPAALGIADRTA